MFRSRSRILSVAALAALLAAACGDDDGGLTPDAGPDAAADASGPDASPDASPSADCPEPQGDFIVYDLSVMPPSYPTKTFQCVAAGQHGVVWVEQSIWESEMTQAEANTVLAAFDRATPADPARGIFELTTATFGEPSDVDQNDRVYLLFYELGSYGGSEFDGFIRREDVLGGARSNHAEIVYVDGVRNDPTSEYVLGVVAHEFQHLIHVAHDQNEAGWLEESLSEAAMVRTGYLGDLEAWVPSWVANPNRPLTEEPPNFHYGAGFLFGAWLLERYGDAFLAALVEQPADGVAGLEATLADHGETDGFGDLLGDWALANYLDAPAVEDGRYGYAAFDLPAMTAYATTVPTTTLPRTLQPHGAFYYVLTVPQGTGTTVEVAVDTSAWQDVTVRWAAFPDGSPEQATAGRFDPTAASDVLAIPGLGGQVDRLVVVIVETGGVTTAAVDVTATVL